VNSFRYTGNSPKDTCLALFFLLVVLFFVIVVIVLFAFPPHRLAEFLTKSDKKKVP
jgi:hypothetical protein